MIKSTYEEAVETLNKYRNQNYNSTNKDEVELANAINVILPNYVKQEKLLKLYKELQQMNECLIIAFQIPTLSSAMDKFNEMGGGIRKQELLKQIKEMELEK